MKKNIHLALQLMIHLTVSSQGAPEGTFDDASKDTIRDFNKDAQRVHVRFH